MAKRSKTDPYCRLSNYSY